MLGMLASMRLHRVSVAGLVAGCALIFMPLGHAQPVGRAPGQTLNPDPTEQAAPVASAMTNADVIELSRAGLSETVIIAAIRHATSASFETDVDGLIALKRAGVSDAVISVMQNPRENQSIAPANSATVAPAQPNTTSTATSVPTSSAGVPAEVLAPHAPGIYLDQGNGRPSLTVLEPTVFTQGKTGGIFASAMTWGLYKAKWKAIVRSPNANLRTKNQQPTFYFYFESNSSGLGSTGGFAGWLGAATSPNEFVLVQMMETHNSRELIVGEFGAFGSSSGTRSEDTVPLRVDRVAPGIYQVVPTELLGAGEFCFFYAPGATTLQGGAVGKLFDFGVDVPGTETVPDE